MNLDILRLDNNNNKRYKTEKVGDIVDRRYNQRRRMYKEMKLITKYKTDFEL